jgi:hypothetical protein
MFGGAAATGSEMREDGESGGGLGRTSARGGCSVATRGGLRAPRALRVKDNPFDKSTFTSCFNQSANIRRVVYFDQSTLPV